MISQKRKLAIFDAFYQYEKSESSGWDHVYNEIRDRIKNLTGKEWDWAKKNIEFRTYLKEVKK